MKTTNTQYSEALDLLKSIGQEHLLQGIDKYSQQDRQHFADQVLRLNQTCPGGLADYVKRAKVLLNNSKLNINPYEGYDVSIPQGQNISFKDLELVKQFEKIGIEEVQHTCFVLVAGGLGERLGYDGIKIGIPVELITKQCFLEYYFNYIHAFQCRSPKGVKLPVAIMTSDDTHDLTLQLLEQNNYFCLQKDQVTLMKQQKVPAMMDNEARFALEKNKLLIDTKPHGHGDVHSLLHQTGLTADWVKRNMKWVVFFQDTNPLCFRALPAVLGVSKSKKLSFNSITVPRKPGEAVGAICKLTNKEKKSLIINVEYNQLASLIPKEPVDSQGYSQFPGNINCFVVALPEYSETLAQTKGVVPEFVNPKYADIEKTKFTSSARLESMMQDYPRLLSTSDHVGFTQIDREFSFTTMKNNLETGAKKQQQNIFTETASSCESDFYRANAQLLRFCGAEIGDKDVEYTFAGIKANFGPRIVLDPHSGCTVEELQKNFKGTIKISSDSTLVIKGTVKIINLELDGILKIESSGLFKDITIKDSRKHKFLPVDVAHPQTPSYLKIRGYDVKVCDAEDAGEHQKQ